MYNIIVSLVIISIILIIHLLIWAASRYKKVGPNQVLVVYRKRHSYKKDSTSKIKSSRGFRIVKGGGTVCPTRN